MRMARVYLPHFYTLREILDSPEFEGLPIPINDGPEKQNVLVDRSKEAADQCFRVFRDFTDGDCRRRDRE